MCGIAAFSLAPGSNINARALAHALLTQIEDRGSHASGFAYVDQAGNPGIYKQPKPGSQLSLGEMPRRIKSAILHTRYATQGLPSDNRNNHPVLSTDNRIALVHNGVISNDHQLREGLGITDKHGEVDSIVIPSLIAQGGVKDLSKLAGYAAIAWIDGTEGNGVIRIARLKTSPVAYTHLFDGSFVMASTPQLLRKALEQANLEYGAVFELDSSKLISVSEGWIYDMVASPQMTYNSYAYQKHGAATAGGHGATQTRQTYTPPTKSAAPAGNVVQPTAGTPTGPVGAEATKPANAVFPENTRADGSPKSDDDIYAELEEWRKRRDDEDAKAAAIVSKAVERAKTHGSEDSPLGALEFRSAEEFKDDAEWEEYVAGLMEDQRDFEEAGEQGDSCSLASRYVAGEGFYVVDGEGDMSHYQTLDELELRLAWVAKFTKSDQDLFQVNDDINWCNHIVDMGTVDDDGNLDSWVDDMAGIDDYESPAIRNLQYIREGVGRLVSLKGA